MNFTIVNVLDPQSGNKTSIIVKFSYILAILVFLMINGHHYLVLALVCAFELVPKADSVITNPLHPAVALHYDAASMQAAPIVAKGSGILAQRIKAIALQHDIPLVDDKPLAQNLYWSGDIDEETAAVLYSAVAEFPAHIYRLKGRVHVQMTVLQIHVGPSRSLPFCANSTDTGPIDPGSNTTSPAESGQDLSAAAEAFQSVTFESYISTELDETCDGAAMVIFLLSGPRPLSYFASGQRVPEDIEPANKKRLAALLLQRRRKRISAGGNDANCKTPVREYKDKQPWIRQLD